MRGQLLHGIHRECADVVVRNLTVDGAKLRLTAPSGLVFNGRLVLRLLSGDRVCGVVWQSGDELGVSFDEPGASA